MGMTSEEAKACGVLTDALQMALKHINTIEERLIKCERALDNIINSSTMTRISKLEERVHQLDDTVYHSEEDRI